MIAWASSDGINAGGAPYAAESVGPYGLWIVANRMGTNVAHSILNPGQTLMDEPQARAVAAGFNLGSQT